MNRLRHLILLTPVALPFACSVPEGHLADLDGGAQAATGSTGVGGTGAKAGSSSTGGSAVTAGGTQAAGGTSGSGGSQASSSTTALGGAGGTSTAATGGVTTVAGAGNLGGVTSAGGTNGAGGSAATGGTPSTGGASAVSAGGTNTVSSGGTTPVATGGTRATGGTTSAIVTGGAVSTGGTPATGGAATGGAATGGTPATGGAATGGAATGGTPATGGATTGGAATGGYSATPGCLGNSGPAMVKLPQGYCIDSTEVTRDQYAAWLATTPALPASSDANCGWKSMGSYAADATCMGNTTYVCEGTNCGNQPQVCVDWCEAYAYCAGVGKRLCGKIGGGTNADADYANASLSQWFNACSSNGANTYPYVGTYQAATCNAAGSTTTAVGSLSGCQAPAPYSGAYDLSGNVYEWEDSCSGVGQTATCRIRGGGFGSSSSNLACGGGYDDTRDGAYDVVGFRCCSP